ncbi:MAG: Fis family GAF modulated sigma54 specific transcriptional regulator [Comamonadaceae bacterium]|nr:MAG: Fis family GAF modulated sigma54 specific transcriptional regulator [Comamonadaceae bacterium]
MSAHKQSLQALNDSGVNADRCLLITESHARSAAYGIACNDEADYARESQLSLLRAMDENRLLFKHAAPVMETLYAQIVNTHSVILLTDSDGLVLHSLGDPDFLTKASKVALIPGVNWSEKSKGTNAIGTALHENQAMMVQGDQHFMQVNQSLTCSCAPIVDPHGKVIGALDVTGDQRSSHQHTLALVRMSGQMIENHMFSETFNNSVAVHFHARPEFLGTLVEGIAVFSPDGRFLSANRSAQFQLGLSLNGLHAHTFYSLFGLPISRMKELDSDALQGPRKLDLFSGLSVWCTVKMKSHKQWLGGLDSRTDAPKRIDPPAKFDESSGQKKSLLSSLRYLDTGDTQVSTVIRKLAMVRNHDIPIMILGETGTGKDLMAQAIHSDSNRAAQRFVSVNCASIPETLIESELFGYEEGAFTGARKKGSVGKIQQADGGTLFLDEIGDMPKHLQARLLRVLQDRKVSPLGASKDIEVDVAIICATHQNLKELIVKGSFREDLYYRLNGLVVRLPALRERTDFDVVSQRILQSLCKNTPPLKLSPPVSELFKRYPWPGNFRQLHNLLRTAVVIACEEDAIQLHHLPDDFLEDAKQIQRPEIEKLPPVNAEQLVDKDDSNLQDITLAAMAQTLRLHKGNVSTTAKALGVSRNTIYRKKSLLPPGAWD